MFKNSIMLLVFLVIAGCMGRTIETTVPFDPNEVAYINKSGSATIDGQAFLRQNGGGVVTCAGETVTLIPAGQYATQRMSQIFGDVKGGRINAYQGANQDNIDPRYLTMVRTTACDAEGDFVFNKVANGDYYVATRVVWSVPGSYVSEGGGLARRVSIRGGRSTRVLLN